MPITPTGRPTPFSTTDAIDPVLLDAPPPPPEERPAPGSYLALGEGERRRLVPLTQPITHIGRGFTADVQLEDPSISRRHAIVIREPDGRVRILDDRSSNGTFVNGRRIAEAELCDGDAIGLGRVVLAFVHVD